MSNIISADQLRLFIERIETLEEEKRGIADDIKDVYAEAKGTGFDTKTIRAIVKLRKIDDAARREAEALLDTYKAALGMLGGTPLGHWAIERLEKARKPDPAHTGDQAKPDSDPNKAVDCDDADDAAPPAPPPALEWTVDDARLFGRLAAQAGKPVTANPFPPRDLRRAAWDEAWCGEIGSDGMDIPDALKPASRPKKASDDEASGERDQ